MARIEHPVSRKLRFLLDKLIPRWRRRVTQSTTDLTGNYSTWREAVDASGGYDSEEILERTRAALLKVKEGEAAYERDSVLFEEIQYSWPMLSGLLATAIRFDGELSVLDFGGSLGSSYYQNRKFLSELRLVEWNVVEQPRHVEVGRQWFQDHQLRFFSSIAECFEISKPTAALLSGTLQYVPDPHAILGSLFHSSISTVIVDRTPFWNGDHDRLCVQTVPPTIYAASYPSWIFSRANFLSSIPAEWDILARFESFDALTGPVELGYEGFILVRIQGH